VVSAIRALVRRAHFSPRAETVVAAGIRRRRPQLTSLALDELCQVGISKAPRLSQASVVVNVRDVDELVGLAFRRVRQQRDRMLIVHEHVVGLELCAKPLDLLLAVGDDVLPPTDIASREVPEDVVRITLLKLGVVAIVERVICGSDRCGLPLPATSPTATKDDDTIVLARDGGGIGGLSAEDQIQVDRRGPVLLADHQ